ncbi:ParB/RepB/Spo0J family partition protein [Rhizobium arsenicireducens]
MSAVSTKSTLLDSLAPMRAIEPIAIAAIDIPAHHRKHSRADVAAMAESIAVHGQQQPIEIERRQDAIGCYRLIFGSLRVHGTAFLGREAINAIVREPNEFASDGARRLRSFTENMARVRLGALDRAVAIADWCEIYRATQPRLKPGRKPSTSVDSLSVRLNSDDAELMAASESFTASFSEAAQAFLGISRAGVFRAIKIASISSLQRERMALTWIADSEGELYRLATVKPVDRQVSIIDLILGEKAGSVEEAIALLDGTTRNRPAKWEVVHQRFSRLPAGEQDHFLDLNEAAVTRWQTQRGAR